MPKLTLVDLANLNNQQAAVSTINLNNAAIEAAMEITLSRDGTQPNEMNANLDMNSNRILNLPEPVTDTEPVRKIDIENIVGGSFPSGGGIGAYKEPARVATVGPITLSGLQTVDGIALSNNDRVLVKNQVDATQNGVYVAQAGPWLRAVDFDSPPEVVKGSTVLVLEGSFAEIFFYLTSNNPITIGVSALNFDQIDVTFDPLLARQVPTLNMFFGYAGNNSLEGDGNVAMGGLAFINQTTGHNNVAIGLGAMNRSTEGYQNVGIGALALGGTPGPTPFTGAQNVVIGAGAGPVMTTGSFNVLIGEESGADLTTGSYNVGVGLTALQHLTSGVENTALGADALLSLQTGLRNVAVGANALGFSTSGDENTAVGESAMLHTTTAYGNVALGKNALMSVPPASGIPLTGTANVAIGPVSLQNAQDTCSANTAVGYLALNNVTVGNNNIAMGFGAGMGITTGSGNTIIMSGVSALPADLQNTLLLGVGSNIVRLQIDSAGILSLPSYAATDGVLEITGGVVSVNPSGAGVSTIGGEDGDITLENTFTMSGQQLQLTANGIPNSKLVQTNAATLKGNPTAGQTTVSDFTIQGLSPIGTIDPVNDNILVYDLSTNTFKKATPGEIAAAATAGVASIGGATGAIALDPDTLTMAGSTLSTAALSGDVTTLAGSFNTVIGANKVDLGMLKTISPKAILGRRTAGTGNVEQIIAGSGGDANVTEKTALNYIHDRMLITDAGTSTIQQIAAKTLVAKSDAFKPGSNITITPVTSADGYPQLEFASTGGTGAVTSVGGLTGIINLGATLTTGSPNAIQTQPITGAVTSPANSFVTTLASNIVSNANLADMGAATIKGNPTASALADPSNFTISSLAALTPDPTADFYLVHDSSTGDLKRSSVLGIINSASDLLVRSVNGLENAVTLLEGPGIGLTINTTNKTITITNTGSGSGGTAGVASIGGLSGVVGITDGITTTTGNNIEINPSWMEHPGNNWYIAQGGNSDVDPQNNIAIGNASLASATDTLAQDNIAIGLNALNELVDNSHNIAIGNNAMRATRTQSTAVLTINAAALPVQGETVSIGTSASTVKVYEFRNTLTTPPAGRGYVLIGATNTECLANLTNCIKNTGAGFLVDAAHPIVTAVSGTNTMRITTLLMDSAYNSFPIQETFASDLNKWDCDVLYGGGEASQSVAIGSNALEIASDSWNVAIGYTAGKSIIGSNQNVLIGKGSGFGQRNGIGNNVYVGYEAGYGSHNGTANSNYNVGVGTLALQWIGLLYPDPGHPLEGQPTTLKALENTAVGATAGLSIITGNRNVAIGANAMGGNVAVVNNVITRGTDISGADNIAIGNQALRCVSTGNMNIAIGGNAMWGTWDNNALLLTGNYNIAIGKEAMVSVTTTATRNICIGTFAGHSLTTGTDNLIIGQFAGVDLINTPSGGNGNIIIGNYVSGFDIGITTGSNNTIVGKVVALGNVSNNVVLATHAGVQVLRWTGTGGVLRFPVLPSDGIMTIVGGDVTVPPSLAVNKGGTGVQTWNQGDIVYASVANTLAGLAKSAVDNHYLKNTGTNNAPQWGVLNLDTSVTGTLQVERIEGHGSAVAGSFLRQDGTWVIPSGGGGGTVSGPGATVANRIAIYADSTGNNLDDLTIGGVGTVLHGAASGIPAFSAVDLTADVSGQLPVANIVGWTGPADTSKFLRHDGTWVAPPGGGGGGGDVFGPASSSIGQLAVFSATDGKNISNSIALGTASGVLHGGATPAFGAVSLTAEVSGTLPVGSGGTGLTTGTSGGIPYFSNATTLASSGVLTLRGPVLGGGAGAAPTSMAAATANGQLIVGQAGAAPLWQSPSGAFTMNSSGVATLASGLTITTPTLTTPTFTGTTTIANAAAGLLIFSHTGNPSSGVIGRLRWDGLDSGGAGTIFGDFYSQIITNTAGSEDAWFAWNLIFNGTFTQAMTLGGAVGTATSIDLEVINGGVFSSDPTAGIGYKIGAGGSVTQGSSGATVTLNKVCGKIITANLTTAAGAEEEFTVNNSTADAEDVIILSTQYNGTGTPVMSVKGQAAGNFKIVITNVHASAAFNNALVINFAVIKTVST